MTKKRARISLLAFLLFSLSFIVSSQTSEITETPSHLNGAITATNNGISFIPTFSLGKPAVIFDLSIGKRLSFDPQFRFALEGKPWSFLFWWRYKLITNDKFRLTVGAHPALSFKTLVITTENGTKEFINVQRYLAGELSPNYFISMLSSHTSHDIIMDEYPKSFLLGSPKVLQSFKALAIKYQRKM